MPNIDLDQLIDYRQAYSDIEKAKITGDNLIGCCPFHGDTKPSFSVDLKTGLFNCFSCGESGNYIQYRAKREGIDTSEAYKKILEERGLDRDIGTKAKTAVPDSYTVEDYAKEKHLPAQWLKTFFAVSDGKDKRVGPFVSMQYFNEQQEKTVFRKRYPKGSAQRFAWSNGSKGKLTLYGEWLMDRIREEGYVILCEGESDTQTLWYLGIPALGVPGATTYKPEWTKVLSGLQVYLHVEPDNGGQVFRTQMVKKLHQGEFLGQVFTWSCGPTGHKDPSDLYIAMGDDAASKIKELLKDAKQIDLEAENKVEVIPGAPISLTQPDGWIYSDNGISIIEERTMQPKCICRTPIILTKRMRNDIGEEKVELAFKRDGQWMTEIMPRTSAFQSRNIIGLADRGATVTSENAKQVVSFLSALESENMDSLPLVESTSHCGWQTGNRFFPGCSGDLILDAGPAMQKTAAAYCRNGSLEAWLEFITPNRENSIFRAYIAAAFAAPLLKLLNVRNFILYNWVSSSSGKTAALKAALSVWGDPNRLMISCDSTKAALERRATFFCDLPFGIDERQSAGDRQDFLENLAYMLANGIGRARASKEEGGLQTVMTWRTIAIMTGEEPLIRNATKGGVSNRTLELYGAPFHNEQAAIRMHQCCDANCGWAGPAFISELLKPENMNGIEDDYKVMLQQAISIAGTKRASQAANIAILGLADYSAEKWLWGTNEEEAKHQAFRLMRDIIGSAEEEVLEDEDERAVSFLKNWVIMNWKNFQEADNAPVYGWITEDEVCIIPSALRRALEDEKYSSRRALHAYRTAGIMKLDGQGKNTMVKRHPKSKALLRVHTFRKEAVLGFTGDGEATSNMEIITEPDEDNPFAEDSVEQTALPF